MACCGKKTSIFCLCISIWGTIQLTLMGIFYAIHSLTLLDDLPLASVHESLEDFRNKADEAYSIVAIRCFATAALYLIFAILSCVCYRRNKNKEKRQSLLSKQKNKRKDVNK